MAERQCCGIARRASVANDRRPVLPCRRRHLGLEALGNANLCRRERPFERIERRRGLAGERYAARAMMLEDGLQEIGVDTMHDALDAIGEHVGRRWADPASVAPAAPVDTLGPTVAARSSRTRTPRSGALRRA